MRLSRILVIALCLTVAHLRAASNGASESDAKWIQDLLAWRTNYAKELHAPNGWFSVVGLDWLQSGNNSFGSAQDNQIRIRGAVAAHLGILRLDGGTIHLEPPQGGFPKGLLIDGHVPTPGILAVDGHPSQLTYGTFDLFVIHRGRGYALRIKDSNAYERLHFHGLRWYAPNPNYRVTARWIPYNPPRLKKLSTVIGTNIELPAPGIAEFSLRGKTVRLEPVLESKEARKLFFIVRDLTSRTTTYGASRFLYTDLPDPGVAQPGTLLLDFNRLENPPCAYTAYATCPLPPQENRLSIPLPVGEKRYHHE